jgi:hypothetical protein
MKPVEGITLLDVNFAPIGWTRSPQYVFIGGTVGLWGVDKWESVEAYRQLLLNRSEELHYREEVLALRGKTLLYKHKIKAVIARQLYCHVVWQRYREQREVREMFLDEVYRETPEERAWKEEQGIKALQKRCEELKNKYANVPLSEREREWFSRERRNHL